MATRDFASFLGLSVLAVLLIASRAEADEPETPRNFSPRAIELLPDEAASGELLGRRFLTSLRVQTAARTGTTGGPEAAAASPPGLPTPGLDDDLLRAGEQSRGGSASIELVQGIDTGGPLQPFLSGGLGATRLPQDNLPNLDDLALTNDLQVDFHLGAGIGYQLDPQVHLTAGYRYVETLGTVAAFGGPLSDQERFSNSDHVFGLSLRVPFWVDD